MILTISFVVVRFHKKNLIHDVALIIFISFMQEIRGAKKFRYAGIEPSLKFKFDRIYSNIVATEEYAWAPSSGVLSGTDVDPDTSNVNIDGVDLKEACGDSKEDEIPNLDNDMSRMVGGVNMLSNNNIRSSDKRKEREPSKVRARKKKTSGIGVQLLSKWDELLESMSTRSDSTSLHMDQQGYSIPEVMVEFHSISRVSIDDDFHDFAMEYLSFRRKREMWSSMGGLEKKLKWLK